MYRSPNTSIVGMFKSRRFRWAGHVARMEKGRSAFKMLIGKLTGKRPLGRSQRRWEDNIRMDLKERGIKTRNFVGTERSFYAFLTKYQLNLSSAYFEVV